MPNSFEMLFIAHRGLPHDHTDSAEALHNDVEDGPDEFDPPGH